MRRIAIAVAVLTAVERVGRPPASIQVGATFKLAVRMANAAHRQAAGGRVTVTLRTSSGRKRKLAGATLQRRIPGGATRTLVFTIPVRASVPAGAYDLVACVRRTGQVKGDCKTARTVTIVR